MRYRRFNLLRVAIAEVALRHITFGNEQFFNHVFTVDEGDGVNRKVHAADVVDFEGSFVPTFILNIPVERLDTLHCVRKFHFPSPTALLFQLRCNGNHFGLPLFALRHARHVVVAAHIVARADPEVVRHTFVIILDDLACRKVSGAHVVHIHHGTCKRSFTAKRIPRQQIRQLGHLGRIACRSSERDIELATSTHVVIQPELAVPFVHAFFAIRAILEVLNKNGFAFLHLENKRAVEHGVVRGICGCHNKGSVPALEVVSEAIARRPYRGSSRIGDQSALGDNLRLHEEAVIEKCDDISIRPDALQVVDVEVFSRKLGFEIPADTNDGACIQVVGAPAITILQVTRFHVGHGNRIACRYQLILVGVVHVVVAIPVGDQHELVGGAPIFIGELRARTDNPYGVEYGNADILRAAKETNTIIRTFHGVRGIYGDVPSHSDYAIHLDDTIYLGNAVCRNHTVYLDDVINLDDAVRSDGL